MLQRTCNLIPFCVVISVRLLCGHVTSSCLWKFVVSALCVPVESLIGAVRMVLFFICSWHISTFHFGMLESHY
jgi:hypothetical protein